MFPSIWEHRRLSAPSESTKVPAPQSLARAAGTTPSPEKRPGLIMKLTLALLALIGFGSTAPNPHQPHDDLSNRVAWPNGPFVTSGRWIVDASGKNLTYAGTNWPGHADVMIPEGLQYQSIETIVQKIKSVGMNAVRLTFAIQMVDEIYTNGGTDVTLQTAFTQALGQANGAKVLAQLLAKNPRFTASTTRLQVFDAVAAELARQQIYVHLDNHISKGMWCCSSNDGNGWWGDQYFSQANWTRGLAYMVNHVGLSSLFFVSFSSPSTLCLSLTK